MDRDLLIGLVVLAAAVLATTALLVRSRWIINRIAARRLSSAREIIKELNHGR